jgi:hypothetical protein
MHVPKPDTVICSKLLIKRNLTISFRKKCSQSFVGLLLWVILGAVAVQKFKLHHRRQWLWLLDCGMLINHLHSGEIALFILLDCSLSGCCMVVTEE